jgi:hypothetical protein
VYPIWLACVFAGTRTSETTISRLGEHVFCIQMDLCCRLFQMKRYQSHTEFGNQRWQLTADDANSKVAYNFIVRAQSQVSTISTVATLNTVSSCNAASIRSVPFLLEASSVGISAETVVANATVVCHARIDTARHALVKTLQIDALGLQLPLSRHNVLFAVVLASCAFVLVDATTTDRVTDKAALASASSQPPNVFRMGIAVAPITASLNHSRNAGANTIGIHFMSIHAGAATID